MDNAQIARDVIEDLFSKGNLALVDQNFERTYRGHDPLLGEINCDQLKKEVQMYRAAFPDMTCKVDELIAAADKVLVRWTMRGTHKGPLLGRAPTGRKVEVQGLTVVTFRNGKIAEDYSQWDVLHLFQELGIAPQISAAGAQAPAT
jgi:steroid delta-isomerase-like uncharacterized protein